MRKKRVYRGWLHSERLAEDRVKEIADLKAKLRKSEAKVKDQEQKYHTLEKRACKMATALGRRGVMIDRIV